LVDRETLELESYYKFLKKELEDLKNEKAPIQQDEQILTTIKEIIRTASENNNSNLVMQQQQFFQFMMQQQQQQMLLQQTQYQNNVNPGMGYPFQNNNPMMNSQ
jgi:tetraacyldisaccharide-1-P 4'-kinase